MDLAELAIELAVGCGVGFTIGLTGVGGGVLVIPALTVILGMPATTAVGTASAYAFLTKVYAGFEHWRLRTIDFRLANLFLLGAIPGNIAACLAIGAVKQRASDPAALAAFQAQLTAFIAGVMIFSVILMLANLARDWMGDRRGSDRPETPTSTDLPLHRRLVSIGLGALIGAILGATSVGGGVIIVPLLIVVFGLSASRTVGTSIYLALILTLVTSILSAGRGDVDYQVAGLMAVGSMVGVFFGSRLAVRLPERMLQGAVVVLLLVAIAAMLLKQGH